MNATTDVDSAYKAAIGMLRVASKFPSGGSETRSFRFVLEMCPTRECTANDNNAIGLPYKWFNDERAIAVIDRAMAGDKDAHKSLIDVASKYIQGGLAMPKNLSNYVVGYLKSAPAATPDNDGGRPPNLDRDYFIYLAVVSAASDGHLSPTRNKATKDWDRRESAASVVARAAKSVGLRLSEKRINVIFHNINSKMFVPLKAP